MSARLDNRQYVGPSIATGKNFAILANQISDAIYAAHKRGMEIDESVCCAAAVLADYARMQYGADYLDKLAQIIVLKKGDPHPLSEAKP